MHGYLALLKVLHWSLLAFYYVCSRHRHLSHQHEVAKTESGELQLSWQKWRYSEESLSRYQITEIMDPPKMEISLGILWWEKAPARGYLASWKEIPHSSNNLSRHIIWWERSPDKDGSLVSKNTRRPGLHRCTHPWPSVKLTWWPLTELCLLGESLDLFPMYPYGISLFLFSYIYLENCSWKDCSSLKS